MHAWGKTIERLLTAYQEDLVSLDQLRERMPLLRQREQTLRQELNVLVETDSRPRRASASRRNAFGVSDAFAGVGRDTRHRGAATDRAAPRQGGPRKRRHARDSPLYSRSLGTAANGVPDPMAESATSPTPQVTFCVQGVAPHSWGNFHTATSPSADRCSRSAASPRGCWPRDHGGLHRVLVPRRNRKQVDEDLGDDLRHIGRRRLRDAGRRAAGASWSCSPRRLWTA